MTTAFATTVATCHRCRKAIPSEQAFTLTHAGPQFAHVYCEPCADKTLAEYQARYTPPPDAMVAYASTGGVE